MLMPRVVVAVAAVLLLCSASPAPGADGIPRDFRLTAEYYPPLPTFGPDARGGREWHRWTLTVTAAGHAVQETQQSARGSVKGLRTKSVRLPRHDVARLVATVRGSKFHALAPEYAFAISPAAALVLRIAMDDRYHEVTVYGPDRLKHNPDVAAFLRVWNQTLRLMPPPNRGQDAE